MTSSIEFVRLPCPTQYGVYARGGGGGVAGTVFLLSSVSQDSPIFASLVIVLAFGRTSAVTLVLLRDPCDHDSNALSLQTT